MAMRAALDLFRIRWSTASPWLDRFLRVCAEIAFGLDIGDLA